MNTHYKITAYGKKGMEDTLRYLLGNLEIEGLEISSHTRFETYLETLPDKEIPGFSSACVSYINKWADEGGAGTMETAVENVCSYVKSNPRMLAGKILDALLGSTDEFEAVPLIQSMFKYALRKTQATQPGQKVKPPEGETK